MGWQDRQYARGASYDDGWSTPSIGGGLRAWWRGSVVAKLIVINALIFFVCTMTNSPRRGGGLSPIYDWGVLDFSRGVQGLQVWRLVTAMFLHANFWHVAMNMFGLWMFGRPVESSLGPRKTLMVYLVSGLLGNVLFVALCGVGYFGPSYLLGASGCVLAMMGAAAVMFPHMRVSIFYGLFPMPIRVLALIFGVMYFLNAVQRGSNAGGDVCHLVGLLAGAGWVWRRTSDTRGFRQRVREVFHRRPAARPSVTVTVEPRFRPSEYERDQAELDALLGKVKAGGLNALSAAERGRLQEISERMRGDYTRR